MDVKADHRAAGLSIHLNFLDVHLNPNHVTLALNKPKKVLSAMDKYERVFHMGRLDYDSEGLILMTNDGELSQHVMHPKYEGLISSFPEVYFHFKGLPKLQTESTNGLTTPSLSHL